MTCGLHARYTAGCTDCQRAAARYNRERNAAIAAGTWQPPVPVAEVRAHLRRLKRARMSTTEIAAASGVYRETLYEILSPRIRRPRKYVHGPTAAAVLAVPVPKRPAGTVPPRGQRNLTPALATRRRIEAMAAQGHDLKAQAAAAPVGLTALRRIVTDSDDWRREWVTVDVERRVAELYDRWSLVRAEGIGAGRARDLARRRGWYGPGAWDDDTIGDPKAQPYREPPRRRRDEVEPSNVLGCVTGAIPAYELTTAERVEAVAHLARMRKTDAEIAEVTRWDEGRVDDEDRFERALRAGEEPVRGHEAVGAFRRNHGIPAAAPRHGTHHPAPNIPHDVDELSGAA